MSGSTPDIVLASGSAVRHRLLTQAGIVHVVAASDVEEAAIKAVCRRNGADVAETAHRLAAAKASAVGADNPGRLVIGADQILDLDGVWFDKPADRAAAANHLRTLAGKTHHLVNATVVWRDGAVLWRHDARIAMTMRPLTYAFIDDYLDAVGDAALTSVGAYQLEGRGAQLFERTEGDFFGILGLPLLPLMAFLRERGVLET